VKIGAANFHCPICAKVLECGLTYLIIAIAPCVLIIYFWGRNKNSPRLWRRLFTLTFVTKTAAALYNDESGDILAGIRILRLVPGKISNPTGDLRASLFPNVHMA